LKPTALALMGAASPDLEKQGFLAVFFVYREYSEQQESAPYSQTKFMMTMRKNIIK